MPSLLPIAMNAGTSPPFAAACAAALCWFAPEICMIIFSRSRGAVQVFASAPAVPPARKSARPDTIRRKCQSRMGNQSSLNVMGGKGPYLPVPNTCVTTAIGRRSINRFMVSLSSASSFFSVVILVLEDAALAATPVTTTF